MLDKLGELLSARGIVYLRLDGSVGVFQQGQGMRMFVTCTCVELFCGCPAMCGMRSSTLQVPGALCFAHQL